MGTTSPDSPSVAVIVLTFNEEANLEAALDSVRGWSREVYVVDSYSTDRTVDIALSRREDGVHVVQHAFENYSAQWNWALTRLPIRAAWTLKLDADERVTPQFKDEVGRLIAKAAPELEGLFFRRYVVFMGAPLRWGGMTQNFDLRMWRSHKASFEDRAINEHAVVQGKTAKLRSFVLHENSKSLADWLDKHNRYSSLEAISILKGNTTGEVAPRYFGTPNQRAMWWKRLYFKVPARALWYFLYRYVWRGGFLDGRGGFRFALLHAMFLYWIDLKTSESRSASRSPEVIWPRRGDADPRVANSPLQIAVNREAARREGGYGAAAEEGGLRRAG